MSNTVTYNAPCGCIFEIDVYHDWMDDITGVEDLLIVNICENHSLPTQRVLDGARFCPACHALLEEGSVYCDTCGTDTPRR